MEDEVKCRYCGHISEDGSGVCDRCYKKMDEEELKNKRALQEAREQFERDTIDLRNKIDQICGLYNIRFYLPEEHKAAHSDRVASYILDIYGQDVVDLLAALPHKNIISAISKYRVSISGAKLPL